MALQPLEGLRVVDLFAGSGALGIEALSRGAAHAAFVESDRHARDALAANLDALGLGERARILPFALPAGLARMKASLCVADLVLLDPPYGGRIANATLAALAEAGVLKPGAMVVVEHHAKDALPERAERLFRQRQRAYGETVVSTYRVDAAEPGNSMGGGSP